MACRHQLLTKLFCPYSEHRKFLLTARSHFPRKKRLSAPDNSDLDLCKVAKSDGSLRLQLNPRSLLPALISRRHLRYFLAAQQPKPTRSHHTTIMEVFLVMSILVPDEAAPFPRATFYFAI
ncbi:MAG: hypothetical protein RL029_489 [Actinomycetota bacterium]